MATSTDPARIVLALDACSQVSTALAESLVTMASRLGAELEGLFVEDAELARAAELPFVCEVLAAGSERVFTPETLRQLNRDMARELDRLLSRAAGNRQVRWHCRTAEGARVAMAFQAAENCDLFVPARPSRQRGPRSASATAFERVGLIVREPAQAARALTVIHALARNGHTREVLLVCEGRPPADLLSALEAERLRTYVQAAPLDEPAEMLARVRSHGPGLLIAPKALLTPAATLRALDTISIPLLLLR